MGKVCFQAIRQIKKPMLEHLMAALSIMAIEAVHSVQVSENVNVSTGLDGETVFGRVETANGRRSIFEIVDGVMASIDPLRN